MLQHHPVQDVGIRGLIVKTVCDIEKNELQSYRESSIYLEKAHSEHESQKQNAFNRLLFFVISETATSQNVNEMRKYYISDET